LIPLNASQIADFNRHLVQQEVRRIVRNVRFEILEPESALRLLGPDMYYHEFDPHLRAALQRFSPPISIDEILQYRCRKGPFHLCFEDSWSGYFIAEHLGHCQKRGNLIIIHLDDHTDMMSTLLAYTNDGSLVDTTTGKTFDPQSPADWEMSIYSGSIGIGCFIVPFYFSDWRTHIRHINNADNASARNKSVFRALCSYDLIPNKRFASVRLSDLAEDADAAGSYLASSRCEDVLHDLPCGEVIVHIDLDYFINDFNGNPREGNYRPPPGLIKAGRHKLRAFFDALCARKIRVDRWIVATSPGFCSAFHWYRLLKLIDQEIRRFQSENFLSERESK
jgi:hypothetical protein